MSNDWVHEYDRLFMADPLVIVALHYFDLFQRGLKRC